MSHKHSTKDVNSTNIATDSDTSQQTSTILSLHDGYGFISYPSTNNLYFRNTDLVGVEFYNLEKGAKVQFTIGKNYKGESVAKDVKLIEAIKMEP